MTTYQEGMIAIFICFTVLNVAIIGIAIYYVWDRTERSREQGVMIKFLVDNLLEILNDRFPYDENKNEEKN